MVQKVQRVIVVLLDSKVFPVLLVQEERRDPLVKLVRMETLEHLDHVDPLELMVLSDKWGILDQLAQEEPKEKKESEVHLVNLDLQVPLDLLGNLLVLTWLLYQL